MKKLKPCPFCGKKDISTMSNTLIGYWKLCDVCGASGPTRQTEEEAVEAWNRRYEPLNEPLTLGELWQMDGEPIFIKALCSPNEYGIKDGWYIMDDKMLDDMRNCGQGEIWLAYRRRPEEAPTHD